MRYTDSIAPAAAPVSVITAQETFNDVVSNAHKKLNDALETIQTENGATDVKALTAYQAALAEYTTARSAQTNSMKAVKDIDASIIQNLR